MGLRAGVGRSDITNRIPLFLAGYPHVPRVSEGVHDPLFATALFASDGKASVLAVAVDILFVHHDTVAACRRRIAAETGVPAAAILISATHTHSGPLTLQVLPWRDDPVVPPPDPRYVADMADGIVAAAVGAVRSAAAAELAVATAYSEGVGCNRHDPAGCRDPEVGILCLRRPGGDILALQLVYSMHPTVLHEDSRLVSADFPHYTRAALEARWPGAAVLYHTGPSGNLSPRYHVRGQTFAEAERLGLTLAASVGAAVAALGDSDFRTEVPIGAAGTRVTLPPRTFCSVAQAEQDLRTAVETYERLRRQNAPHGPTRTAECAVFGAEEKLTLARAQADGHLEALLGAYNPVEVQVLRLGDAYLVGFPGESFVEYALAVKRACPRAFVISLANGELQGYIPTPEATGYEAALSLFEPASGDRLVAAALELLETLRQ